MTALYLCACSIVAYAGFCRLVRVDLRVRAAVRLSFWLLTCSGVLGVAGVLVWGCLPNWPAVSMAVAVAAVQLVASDLWRGGVPSQYIRPDAEDAEQWR
jgi:hypothetical protein